MEANSEDNFEKGVCYVCVCELCACYLRACVRVCVCVLNICMRVQDKGVHIRYTISKHALSVICTIAMACMHCRRIYFHFVTWYIISEAIPWIRQKNKAHCLAHMICCV